MIETTIESQDCIVYLLWEYRNDKNIDALKVNPLWLDTYHQTLYDQVVNWDKGLDLALFCLESKNNFATVWVKCRNCGVVPESFPRYCELLEDAYNTISVFQLLEDSKGLPAEEVVKEVRKFTDKMSAAKLTELELSLPKDAYIFGELLEKARMEKEPELTTGFNSLDRRLWGLRRGEVVTIGARTSRGKSAFALNISRHLVRKCKRVLYFSTEMSAFEKLKRLASMETGIDGMKFRQADFTEEEWRRVKNFTEWYQHGDNFYICDSVSPTLEVIRACVKKVKPDVMVVDYIGLCRLPKADRLDLSIGEFMKQLKSISRSEFVATLVISQLNRQVDARTDKIPTLADLKESGSIEQESDIVMLLYDEPKQNLNGLVRNLVLSVEKNRHGFCGTIKLVFTTNTLIMRENDDQGNNMPEPNDYKLASGGEG